MAAKNSYSVQQLISKLKNPDADLRFMALQDLLAESRQAGFGIDEATEYQLVDQVLGLVNDANGEVKSQAVKTLATLVPLLSPTRHATLIDRLVQFTSSSDEGVRDIASLGLKMVVAEVQPGSTLAGTVCTKLAPEVVRQLNDSSSSAELLLDSLDLLSDILTRFSSTLSPNTALQSSILKAVTPLLSAPRAAVRKRAVSTLATLISSTSTSSSSAALLSSLLNDTLLPSLREPASSGSVSANEQLRTSISLASALARAAPGQLGPRVGEVVPLVLEGSRREDDEGKEGVLQCLESLTLKLPTETGPYLNTIIDKATELLKYDPNFGGGAEDEDEEMGDADEDGEGDEDEFEDEFEDEYDDEDDTSWKVRRSATKLLTSIVSTRPDLLSSFYKTVSPALIARFGDREETVRVEVWATYTALLRQTRSLVKPSSVTGVGAGGVGGAMTPNGGSSPRGNGSLKRKRSDDRMDTEEGPLSQLNAQTPQIVKSIVKQLGAAKALPTRQAAFVLLHELIAVLDGGLETQIPTLVTRIETSMKTADSGLSGAATALKIEVLAFLARFFRTHHVKTFAEELGRLTPLVTAAIGDRFNKIVAEAFVTASELVKVLRPVPSRSAAPSPLPTAYVPHLTSIYQATMDKLAGSEADEDVKGKGIQTLGTLLYHAGDALDAQALEAALSFLKDRLKNEVQRVVAVRTVGLVASSPVLGKGNSAVDAWTAACLPDVSALLRKVHRPLKVAAFEALDSLLERAGPGGAVDKFTAQAILADLTPLLGGSGSGSAEGADVNLLPHALTTLATLLTVSSSAASALSSGPQPALSRILSELVPSPLVQGPSLDALLKFFAAAVRAGVEPKALIQQLGEAGEQAAGVGGQGAKGGVEGEEEGVHAAATAGRCVGVVVREAPGEADRVIKEAAKVIKSSKSSPSQLLLALLTLGEVGRVVDFAPHQATFAKVVDHFTASSEDVRRAAAFAAGNIAVGNTGAFLPAILELIEADDKKRYLALQALKEVIIHSSPDALASISDTLWTPLFDNCEAQEEGTRNVAADCLGQLTVLNPAKYLPQLQARLGADSRHTRATVIAALRYTFTNDSSTYDELLAPLIGEFFKLMQDSDLGVRRLALSSLNSAAHNKPHLVRPHLDTLLPELYAQTEIDESLIRIVEMGPFKHKVDDGLDVRKAAYECMHTLVDACREQIDLAAYLSRVIEGLKDEEEVKKLCYVMLVKLAQVAPTAVQQRLDDTVPPFTEVFGIVLKDTATKQEAERTLELQRSAIRCIAVLNRLSSPALTPKFATFISTQIANGKMASEFKESTRQSQAVAMDLD